MDKKVARSLDCTVNIRDAFMEGKYKIKDKDVHQNIIIEWFALVNWLFERTNNSRVRTSKNIWSCELNHRSTSHPFMQHICKFVYLVVIKVGWVLFGCKM